MEVEVEENIVQSQEDSSQRYPWLPSNSEREEQHKSRQLMLAKLLIHGEECTQREETTVETCDVQHCSVIKNVLIHMKKCEALTLCKDPHCVASYKIIHHWKTCTEMNCEECWPLQQSEKSTKVFFEYLYIQRLIIEVVSCQRNTNSILKDLEESTKLLSLEDRKNLMKKIIFDTTFLAWASSEGYFNVTEYLVERYGADTDIINFKGGGMEETALHRSLIFGKSLNSVSYLLKNGADLNIINDQGQYPLFATYGHRQTIDIDAFKMLVEHGADINKSSIVNRDTVIERSDGKCYVQIENKTVVRYVDNFICYFFGDIGTFTHCAYRGEDEHPLIYCAIHDYMVLFEYIDQHPDVPVGVRIQANEILGAMRAINGHFDDAVMFWKKALNLRYVNECLVFPKILSEPKEEYMYTKEMNSMEELHNCSADPVFISIQALLVLERNSLQFLKDYVDESRHLREMYIRKQRFDLAIKLETKRQNHYLDGSQSRICPFLLSECARSLYGMITLLENENWEPQFKDRFKACEQSLNLLLGSQKIFEPYSVPPLETLGPASLYFSMSCCLASIHYLYKMINDGQVTEKDSKIFFQFVRNLVFKDFRDERGKSMLHIAAKHSAGAVFEKMTGELQGFKKLDHLSLDVVDLLIECGADIHAKDSFGNTPLHTLAIFLWDHYFNSINDHLIQYLIDKGAHVDIPDNEGNTVEHLLLYSGKLDAGRIKLPFPSLSCLAATTVSRAGLLFDHDSIPLDVVSIIKLHEKLHIAA